MSYAIEFDGSSPRLVGPFSSREEAAEVGERIAERRGGMQVWSVLRLISAFDADGLP